MEFHCPKCGKLVDLHSAECELVCPFCYEEIEYVEGKGIVKCGEKKQVKILQLTAFRYVFAFWGRVPRSGYWRVIGEIIAGYIVLLGSTFLFANMVKSRKDLSMIRGCVTASGQNFWDYIASHAIEITTVYTVIAILAMIPITAKRAHDLNLSGWWSLAVLTAFIWFVCPVAAYVIFGLQLLVFGCFKGSDGANRFGDMAMGVENIVTDGEEDIVVDDIEKEWKPDKTI